MITLYSTCFGECRQLVHSLDRRTQKIRSISVSRGPRLARLAHGELLPKRQVLKR
jgi:hypothetical protein